MASHWSYKKQNSSYQGKFQGNVDQGKGNLDQASEELELSDANSFGGREFFIVGEIFVDRTFFVCENFYREFIKTIQNFIIDREYIFFLLESVLVNSLFWRHYTTDKI